MGLSELLRLPQTYMPRLKKLARKVGNAELTSAEVGMRALNAAGKMRIDAAGISIDGPFGSLAFDSDDFKACVEALLKAVDCLPILKGKEILIKKGPEVYKLKLGLIPKKTPSGEWEESDPTLPMIEIDPSGEKDGFKSALRTFGENGAAPAKSSGPGFKIYRIEELAGWTKDWEEFSQVMDILAAAISLTTQKTLNHVSESAPKLIDDALARCGV